VSFHDRISRPLRDRQVERLASVRRDYSRGKASARDVGEILKTCTAAEITEAEKQAGPMEPVMKKLGRWF
jgi:hypothetical protein